MPTKTAHRLLVRWEKSPPGVTPRLTVERAGRGKARSETLGPRGVLTLEEAVVALGAPSMDAVRRSIRTGFLQVRRRGSRYVVTVQECAKFLREMRADGEAALATRGQRTIRAEEVFRRLGD
jgi:hypothetical protein